MMKMGVSSRMLRLYNLAARDCSRDLSRENKAASGRSEVTRQVSHQPLSLVEMNADV